MLFRHNTHPRATLDPGFGPPPVPRRVVGSVGHSTQTVHRIPRLCKSVHVENTVMGGSQRVRCRIVGQGPVRRTCRRGPTGPRGLVAVRSPSDDIRLARPAEAAAPAEAAPWHVRVPVLRKTSLMPPRDGIRHWPVTPVCLAVERRVMRPVRNRCGRSGRRWRCSRGPETGGGSQK